MIETVDKYYLNTVKVKLMKGSSYIELPKELWSIQKTKTMNTSDSARVMWDIQTHKKRFTADQEVGQNIH